MLQLVRNIQLEEGVAVKLRTSHSVQRSLYHWLVLFLSFFSALSSSSTSLPLLGPPETAIGTDLPCYLQDQCCIEKANNTTELDIFTIISVSE